MTVDEAAKKSAECYAIAQRAMSQYNLAMAAFQVACARHDWILAQTEHQTCIDHMDAYLTAVMSCYRLEQEVGK